MPRDKRKRVEREPVVNEAEEVAELEKQVVANAPARGTQPFTEASRDREPFSSLPLSQRTLRGLEDGGFKTMTEIQVAAIPHALAGRDVLGAAKTGSGKTLAFLVPLVEKLYRSRVTFGDGLSALVISPTRELSLQIFEVLRVFGKHHQLSAGLITGGKKEFREEQASVVRVNILVATPGRLLQHLEQTPGFDPSTLQVLVLDEADRILDLGFRDQLNSILEYLPPSRQTMLFSATQTKSVKDLARLSLKKGNVEYVAVRAGKDECATPAKLVQNYVVCELDKKMDVLLGFVKTHIKSKMIAFFSSCAQVRFAFELLCALQPGTSIMALHGKCKHARRTQIYLDFLRKPGAVLLATDIAARGLDFPSVDWVIQVDAPEDAEGYIHRVGRTARYNKGGRALLILVPSEEEGVMAGLKPKNIPIKRLTINPDKVRMAGSVGKKAAALVVSNPDKKRLAEKSFTSYVRAVQLMPNKQVFRLSELPLEDFAFSLGLAAMPRVPGLANALEGASSAGKRAEDSGDSGRGGALGGSQGECEENERQREEARARKNVNRSLQRLKEQIKAEKQRKRMEREAKQNGTSELAKDTQGREKVPESKVATGGGADVENKDDSDDSDEDGGLVLVRKSPSNSRGGNLAVGNAEEDDDFEPLPRKKAKKLRITIDGVAASGEAKRKIFDEDGSSVAEAMCPLEAFANAWTSSQGPPGACGATDASDATDAYVNKVKARLQAVDDEDKERERQRIREKHLTRRMRGKDKKEDVPRMPTLGVPNSDTEGTASSSQSDSNGEGSDVEDKIGGAPGGLSLLGNESDDEEESVFDGEMGHEQTSGQPGGGGNSMRKLRNQEDAVLAILASRPER